MKKKILSSILASAMVISCSAMVMAADKAPTVYVDSSEIVFADQEPVILGEGTTLVPARGVFNALGADVTWDSEKRLVEINSSETQTIIDLTIDDNVMRVYDTSGMLASLIMGQDFVAPETQVNLDVAPQIINDRTMIPLRAISEALKTEVKWDGEQYRIDINTGKAPTDTATMPTLSLSASSAKVNAGETVDLYINIKNLPAEKLVAGATIAINYDKENFEFVDAVMVNGDTKIDTVIGASSDKFDDNKAKTSLVLSGYDNAVKADGAIVKFTFKSINGAEGKFALSNSYDTRLTDYNTTLVVEDGEHNAITIDGYDLVIDETEVVVNGTETVE